MVLFPLSKMSVYGYKTHRYIQAIQPLKNIFTYNMPATASPAIISIPQLLQTWTNGTILSTNDMHNDVTILAYRSDGRQHATYLGT